MKKSGLLLVALAGAAFSATAMAQVVDTNVPPAIPVTLDQIHGGGYARGQYGSRVDLNVYGVGWQTQTGGGAAGPVTAATVYDDVTFGGSCSTTLPININGMAYGFWEPATANPADDHIYMKISFYPDHNNLAAATAAPYSGTPVVANLDLGAGWSGCPGCGQFFGDSITFTATFATLDATNVFNSGASDRTCGVLEELYADAALTIRRDNYGVMRRATFTSWLVGSSDYFGWFDGSSPNTGTIQNNATYYSGGTAAASRATYLDLQATGCAVPAPTPVANLGCLADSPTTTVSGTLADNTVNWYTFCLNADATDDVLHYLDIDSEGSTADVAIAVYTDQGAQGVNSADRDGGSAGNAQLSFGIGRRAATGDGQQYDGRNFMGVAGISAGTTYYLAVAPNASAFGPTGWSVNASGTGGAYTLNLRTNVNGGALAASVAPQVDPADDFSASPLVSPGAQIVAGALNPYTVRWIKFATCVASDNTNTVTIDMTGSDTVNSGIEIFDTSGNLVAQGTSTTGGTTMVFDGTTVLPAGTYYMAFNYNGVQLAPSPTTDGRWHVRSTNGSNGFNFAGEILVNNTECGSNVCCRQDYNGDGSVGTDADIADFFSCLGGACCPLCPPTADFNCDGSVGTDQDIESFFRVLGGGAC